MPAWRREALLALLLVLVTVAVYGPALRGEYLWDDDAHISDNPTLWMPGGLGEIWVKPGATCQYYPLTFSVFWLGYQLWGLNTLGYHLLGVVLHGLAAVLLWQVLKRLKLHGAWLAGAIFALHPICVMSVAWMTELKNTLSAVLALSAAWTYLRFAKLGVYAAEDGGRDGWRSDRRVFYVLSLSLFLLALFAKTAVSFLPLSLLLVIWWQRPRLTVRDVLPLAPMLGLAVLMGLGTIYVEQHSGGASGKEFEIGLVERILISGRAFWFYLSKVVFPYPLSFFYSRWNVDAGAWWQYLYPAATVAVFVWLWAARKRLGKGLFAAMLHFYVSTSMLVLFLVLYMTRYSFVSDHWQYFGFMSLAALAGFAISTGLKRMAGGRGGMIATGCGVLLIVLGGLTWNRAGVYQDSGTLWRDTLAKTPDSWMARNNLGAWLVQQRLPGEAEAEFRRSLELQPDNVDAMVNLGSLLFTQGRMEEARQYLEKALLLDPHDAGALNNLGMMFERQGDDERAIAAYEAALKAKPRLAAAHVNLGRALVADGRLDEGILHFREAVRWQPRYVSARNHLGRVFVMQGRMDEAIEQYRAALATSPGDAQTRLNLGIALDAAGNPGGALEQYRLAVRHKPDLAEAQNRLGVSLAMNGHVPEAIGRFREAVRQRPAYAEAHNNLGALLVGQGLIEEGLAHAEEAVRLQPDYADAHFNLGNALAAAGRQPEAIAHLRQTLQLRPGHPQAQGKLAELGVPVTE